MNLSIIILSFNTKDLLRQCLASVYLAEDNFSGSFEVIVVDNASTDGSAEMVAKDFPRVRLILKAENTGFARANNEGMKIAQGDFYVLLNSDTIISENTLSTLFDFIKSKPKVAIVTPKVVLPDGAIDLACHRGMPTPWNAFTYFSHLARLFPNSRIFAGYHQTYQDFELAHAIDATAATAIMVRKQAVDAVGLFDERFFLYGEDLDWCKRFTDAGWQIYYFPGVTVLHQKSASGKQNLSAKTRREAAGHFYHTMAQFYEKHYKAKYPMWLRQLVLLGIKIKHRLHR